MSKRSCAELPEAKFVFQSLSYMDFGSGNFFDGIIGGLRRFDANYWSEKHKIGKFFTSSAAASFLKQSTDRNTLSYHINKSHDSHILNHL